MRFHGVVLTWLSIGTILLLLFTFPILEREREREREREGGMEGE
jgi:hypothetical protein